jgi:hypothetical protein
MKSLIVLLIVLLAAVLTAPGSAKFNQYLAKKEKNTGICTVANSVRHNSYKFFSFDYVDYCDTTNTSKIINAIGLNKLKTDKYIGLFGTFWKL